MQGTYHGRVTRAHVAVIALWLAALGCGGDGGASDAGARDGGRDASVDAPATRDSGLALAPGTHHGYDVTDGSIGGPERGFYRFVVLTEETDLGWVRDGGHRLVFSYVRLDASRDGPIDAALLARLERGLEAARDARLGVVLRFAYNDGPYPDSEPDAPLAQVLAHIEQVRPILAAHADVLTIVQAGFIGAWGEWHTSTNGLLDDPATRRTILEALLDAMPADRSTQIRYPRYKHELYGEPRTAEDAFDGSYASRVGHHNDCFVSSATDVGTYPSDEVERWRDYVAADTAWVPMGGETCAVFPARSDCEPAMAEMERLHLSFLNEDYHPDVVRRWREQGCYDAIARRLGYRLAVREATFATAARPGGAFALSARVVNEGWAAPFNPRPLTLSLRHGEDHRATTIAHVDVRRWLGGSEHEIQALVQLPADLPEGEHELALALPSSSEPTRADQALPFANAGFDDARGVLVLGTIRVAIDAPGDAATGAAFEATPL